MRYETQKAAEIRAALKAAGYDTRKEVTVRGQRQMYDTIITVTIRRPGIPAQDVREIVEPYKVIYSDDYNGVQLGGCVFVNVAYADDYIGDTIPAKRTEAARLWQELTPRNNSIAIRDGYRLQDRGHCRCIVKTGENVGTVVGDPEAVAEWLARHDYNNQHA